MDREKVFVPFDLIEISVRLPRMSMSALGRLMAHVINLIRSHILSEVRCNVILTNGEIHFDKTVCEHDEISRKENEEVGKACTAVNV